MPFLFTRRRSAPARALSQLRATLGDANLPAIYWTRGGIASSGGFVDSWDDARGPSGFGPQLVGTTTGRPAWDGTTMTFDGSNDFLRNATTGRLAEMTSSCALIVVSTWPAATGSSQALAELSVGSVSLVLTDRALSTTGAFSVSSEATGPAGIGTPLSGLRAFHGRRTIPSGTNLTVGEQVGSGSETTATGTSSSLTPDRLTIGASRTDAASVCALASVSAVLLYTGDYAGKQATVNAFALALGATL